jgi:hypothetical protein
LVRVYNSLIIKEMENNINFIIIYCQSHLAEMIIYNYSWKITNKISQH